MTVLVCPRCGTTAPRRRWSERQWSACKGCDVRRCFLCPSGRPFPPRGGGELYHVCMHALYVLCSFLRLGRASLQLVGTRGRRSQSGGVVFAEHEEVWETLY